MYSIYSKTIRSFILTTILISLCGGIFGQTATFKEVNTKKVKGLVTEYISQSGEIFKTNDIITLGFPFRNEQYDYIQQNAGLTRYPLTAISSGSKVRIKKMKATGRTLNLYTTKPDGMVYGLIIINLDGALNAKEIESKMLSSDEALAKLRRAKLELELKIITQEEYEAVKAELVRYIK